MLRFLNYILNLVIVLAFLVVIVPFAVLAANPTIREVLHTYKEPSLITGGGSTPIVDPNLQFFHTAASVSSMVVLMVVAYILLVVQQFYWFRLTLKTNKFPVPKKWMNQYRYVGVLAAFTITISFIFGMIAWALPIGESTNTEQWRHYFYTREHIYIAFIVITGVAGIATMGYSAYVNLQIAYDQQIKIVDEGIREGKYDPVTRKPYPTVPTDVTAGDTVAKPDGGTPPPIDPAHANPEEGTSPTTPGDSTPPAKPEPPVNGNPDGTGGTGPTDSKDHDDHRATAGFL